MEIIFTPGYGHKQQLAITLEHGKHGEHVSGERHIPNRSQSITAQKIVALNTQNT